MKNIMPNCDTTQRECAVFDVQRLGAAQHPLYGGLYFPGGRQHAGRRIGAGDPPGIADTVQCGPGQHPRSAGKVEDVRTFLDVGALDEMPRPRLKKCRDKQVQLSR